MPLDDVLGGYTGSPRGREYVYPISQDILYDPRVGAESGADPFIPWIDPVPWLIPIPERVVYPAAAPPEPLEDEEMAHDWGHLFREAAGGFLGGVMSPAPSTYPAGIAFADPAEVGPVERTVTAVAGGLGPDSCEGMIWSGGVPPKGFKVVNYCGKGVLRKIRRRRRPRLLTASDVKDIGAVVALVGKGQLAASIIANVGR